MGSWSVSCGISNIAITSGNECCIVPLIESIYDYGGYVPATLPIFGEYDDYGGMENIVEDENTKLIESYLGITIAELVEFLVDGEHTYDRREVKAIAKKLEDNGKLDELSKWRFMWIDKQVYEVMSKNYDTYQKGYHDYGTPEMLALLGFTEVEGAEINNYDPKRFKKKYQRGDFFIYSDGRTMLSEENHYIYHTNKGCKSSIMTYMQLPEELQDLKDKTAREAWRLMSTRKRKEQLSGVFGDRVSFYDDFDDSVMDILNDRIEELKAKGEEVPQILLDRVKKVTKKINVQYLDNLDVFGDLLVGLTNVRGNMHPMSGRWFPHVLYLTPQCGEYRLHQILLEEFARINKSYLKKYGDDEE